MGGAEKFDYYVNAATGLDTNDGLTPSTAWKTLQHTEATATAGKKVLVYPGTYVENSAETKGWYAQKALTWKAKGTVIVRGTDTNTRPLYVFGTGKAEFINFIFDAEGTRATCISCAAGIQNKTFKNCTLMASTTQAILVAGAATNLIFTGCNITVDNVGVYAFNASGAFTYTNGIINQNGANLLLDLSAANITITNNVIVNNIAVASAADVIPFRLTGAGGVKTISGNSITITGAKSAVVGQASSGGTINLVNNTINIVQSVAAPVISFDLGTWVTNITGNTITVSGASQTQPIISLTNQDNPTISGNTLTSDTTAQNVTHIQVLSTGTDVTDVNILNNTFVRNTGEGYIILLGTEETSLNDGKIIAPLVQGNTFYNQAAAGGVHAVMFGHVLNGIAKYNKIYSDGCGYGVVFKSVGTNAYTTGGAFYNLISGGICGVRVRDQAGVKIYNNTMVMDTDTYPVVYITGTANPSTGVLVKNNIIANAGNKALVHNETESLADFVTDYNLFYATGGGNIGNISATGYATLALWQAAGYDANSESGSPLFVSTSDFHLSVGSPAINAGVSVSLTPDLDGVTVSDPPEIGCYEYI